MENLEIKVKLKIKNINLKMGPNFIFKNGESKNEFKSFL